MNAILRPGGPRGGLIARYTGLSAGSITEGTHTASQVNATASAPTGGSGSYTYQWTGDGSNISGATSLTLAWTGRSAETAYTVGLVVTDAVTGQTLSYSTVDMTTEASGGSEPEWAGNLPAGLSLIYDQDFSGTINDADGTSNLVFIEGSSGPGWTGDWECVDIDSSMTHVPAGHTKCAQVVFPEGDLGSGSGVGKLDGHSGEWTEIYHCAWHGFSPNYVFHSLEEKWVYPLLSGPTAREIPGFYLDGAQTPDGGECTLGLSQTISPTGQTYQENGPFPQAGRFHLLESYIKLNSSGNEDGICRFWVDGTLVLDRTDIQFTTGTATIDVWRIDTTRGGGDSTHPVPEGGMFRQMPRIAVYGA